MGAPKVLHDPAVFGDPVALTEALVNIESVSGNERELADQVEATLRCRDHLRVQRFGNTLVARTDLGRRQRVVLAGHLDTVPVVGNLPARVVGDRMYGCGTSDMKSGLALALHAAMTVTESRYDLTYLFYECEEIEAARNGLTILAGTQPELLTQAQVAILLEPTSGLVEAGCQGTLRVSVTTRGVRAHAARSWLGSNAIHSAAEVLTLLGNYQAREVTLDGCKFREGLNAVRINGGTAGNVIPDLCTIEVNFRFAPDLTVDQAIDQVTELFAGFEVEVVDAAPAAHPGLAAPALREFLDHVGTPPRAKLGWTDVARFAQLGIPAVNYGPGDPNLAHTRDEYVEIPRITAGAQVLRSYLS